VSAPVNMNFFCHKAVDTDPQREPDGNSGLGPTMKSGSRPRGAGHAQHAAVRAAIELVR